MEETIERRFEVGPDAKLQISNSSGTIDVRGADTSVIGVKATKRGSADEMANTSVEFSQNGDEVLVTARGQGRTCSVDYDVTVPQDCQVEANSASGRIQVLGTRRSVRANNASGDIEIEDVKGDCGLQSASGSVRGRAIEGALVVQSASGDVEVRASHLSSFELNTASGSCVIETPLIASGAYSARTASGNLTLLLPPDMPATVTLQTMSGGIHSELPAEIVDEGFGKWRGLINGGGVDIEMYSASGELRVEMSAALEAANGATQPPDSPEESRPDTWREPMTSDTTAVLQALERGEMTLDDAMRRLNDL